MPRKRRKPPEMHRLVSMSEVARMAGWTRARMRAHLERLNEQLEGRLLVVTGGTGNGKRYAISLAALRRIHPAWFDHSEIAEDLDRMRAKVSYLSDRVDEVCAITEIQSKAIGRLARG